MTHLAWSFPKEAAKPKKATSYEDAPTQVPMGRIEHGVRRNPDGGQRKVRLQQVRNGGQQKTAGQPASVSDHEAKPEWDTATAHDLCDVCGWPVSKKVDGWVHDAKNPVQWSDKRKASRTAATDDEVWDDDLYNDLEGPFCPTCGGPGVPLGQLGAKHWLRCRNCGMEFSEDRPDPHDAALHTTAGPNKFGGTCSECGGYVEPGEGTLHGRRGNWSVRHKKDECHDERAGPWRSGYGEYPFADEVYDLTHSYEAAVYGPGRLNEPADRLSRELGEPEKTQCPRCGSAQMHASTGYCPQCGHHKETSMNFAQQEATLLNAMAKASLSEQRVLAEKLEEVRAASRASYQADRDLEFSSGVIRDTLTPVATHGMNTTATDWFDEIAIEGSYDTDTDLLVRAEASLWFGRTSAEVRADHEEFFEQAQGMARRTAGSVGDVTGNAERSFLAHACHLAGIVLAADDPDADESMWPVGDSPDSGSLNWPITSPTEGQQTTGDTQDWGLVPNAHASLQSEGRDATIGECPKCQSPRYNVGTGVCHACGFHKSASPQPGQADDSGQAASSLPNEVSLQGHEDVMDNFAPPVAPENAGVTAEDTSSMRAPVIQENKQESPESGGSSGNAGDIADDSGQATSGLPNVNSKRGDWFVDSTTRHAIVCVAEAVGDSPAKWEDVGEISLPKPQASLIHQHAAEVVAGGGLDNLGDSKAKPFGSKDDDDDDDKKEAAKTAGENPFAKKDDGDGDADDSDDKKSSDGQTCAVCGAAIERDPEGETNRTWHHADGDKHDHEAKPKGDSKESKMAVFANYSQTAKRCGGCNEIIPPGYGHRHLASEPIADPSGQGVSGLPQVKEDDDKTMWPWELNDQGKQSEQGAADVDGVHTPGQSVADYPQPKGAAAVHAAAMRQRAFRERVQANLSRQG